MSSAFNKFNQFTDNILAAIINFSTDSFKVLLTNTLPVATNAVKADLTDISAGNGYVAGGSAAAMTLSTSGGIAKVTATDTVFTAAGGTIGPFRYAAYYDDTPTSPAKPLVGWYDYGSAITLNDGETFTVHPDPSAGLLTVI